MTSTGAQGSWSCAARGLARTACRCQRRGAGDRLLPAPRAPGRRPPGGVPACPGAGRAERAGRLLPQLVAYLEAAGAATVTSELAIAWARQPGRARPSHWAQRLAIARGFARYLQTIDPAAEVPPPGVFPARRHRPAPYLWSQHDICRILEAARALRPPLRAATHEAIFGLIAASGLRIGEAIGLARGDVD